MKNIIVFLALFIFNNNFYGQDDSEIIVGYLVSNQILVPVAIYDNYVWRTFQDQTEESYVPKNLSFYAQRIKKWYVYPNIGSLNIVSTSTPVYFNPYELHSGFGYLVNCNPLLNNISWPYNHTITSQQLSIKSFTDCSKNEGLLKDIHPLVSKKYEILNSTSVGYEYFNKSFAKEKDKALNINRAYQCEMDSLEYFYVEAIKDFGDIACKNALFYQAWITKNNEIYKIVYERIGLDDCDFKMLSSMSITPYSTMVIDNERFVLLEQHYWESEDYDIIQIKSVGIKSMLGKDDNYK